MKLFLENFKINCFKNLGKFPGKHWEVLFLYITFYRAATLFSKSSNTIAFLKIFLKSQIIYFLEQIQGARESFIAKWPQAYLRIFIWPEFTKSCNCSLIISCCDLVVPVAWTVGERTWEVAREVDWMSWESECVNGVDWVYWLSCTGAWVTSTGCTGCGSGEYLASCKTSCSFKIAYGLACARSSVVFVLSNWNCCCCCCIACWSCGAVVETVSWDICSTGNLLRATSVVIDSVDAKSLKSKGRKMSWTFLATYESQSLRESVQYRVFSGPHFLVFGLNTEFYEVNLRI